MNIRDSEVPTLWFNWRWNYIHI